MKSDFDILIETLNKQVELYKSIRKDLLKGNRVLPTKRDKQREQDKKKGRKNWKDYE